MKSNQIRIVVILGVIAIISIIFIQVNWLKTAFDVKERQFNETIHIALQNVAENIASQNEGNLANEGIVNQLSSDYFVVNINDVIDANVLQYYLTNEFQKFQIDLDFEYAIYDCKSNLMVYGNHVSMETGQVTPVQETKLPTYDEFIYYFGVRFPSKTNYVFANIKLGLYFSLILLFAVVFFGYAIYVILQQKRLSELQTDFINNMTHEFKTPISSIGLSAEVLQKNKAVNEIPKISNYVKIIKEQTTRLNQQVEKVLQIAKLQQDSLELKKETCNLIEIVAHVKNSFELNVENKGGSIHFDTFSDELIVKADKFHLTNILFNLLDNSLKYNEKNPEIFISVEKIKSKIQLSIKDNGVGIDKKYLKNIFDKFYRVPTGNVHNVKGFGLGLFYVKRIVEEHGWNIQIESEVNKGTKVSITI